MPSTFRRKAITVPVPTYNKIMKTYQESVTTFKGIKNTATPVEMYLSEFNEALNLYQDDNFLLSTRKRLHFLNARTIGQIIDSVVIDNMVYAIVLNNGEYSFVTLYPAYTQHVIPGSGSLGTTSKLFLIGNYVYITGSSENMFGLSIWDHIKSVFVSITDTAYVPTIAVTDGVVTSGKLNIFSEYGLIDDSGEGLTYHFSAAEIASHIPSDKRNIPQTYAQVSSVAERNTDTITTTDANNIKTTASVSVGTVRPSFLSFSRGITVTINGTSYTRFRTDTRFDQTPIQSVKLSAISVPNFTGYLVAIRTEVKLELWFLTALGVVSRVEFVSVGHSIGEIPFTSGSLANMQISKICESKIIRDISVGGSLIQVNVSNSCVMRNTDTANPVERSAIVDDIAMITIDAEQIPTVVMAPLSYALLDDQHSLYTNVDWQFGQYTPLIGSYAVFTVYKIIRDGVNAVSAFIANGISACSPMLIPYTANSVLSTVSSSDDVTALGISVNVSSFTGTGVELYIITGGRKANSPYYTMLYKVGIASSDDVIFNSGSGVYSFANSFEEVADFTKYRTLDYPKYTVATYLCPTDDEGSTLAPIAGTIIVAKLSDDTIFVKSPVANALFSDSSVFTSAQYKITDTSYAAYDNSTTTPTNSYALDITLNQTWTVRVPYSLAGDFNAAADPMGTFYFYPQQSLNSLSGQYVIDWNNLRNQIQSVGGFDGVYAMNNFLILTFEGGFVYTAAFDHTYAPVGNYNPLTDGNVSITDIMVISPIAALMFADRATYWLLGSGEGDLTNCKPVISQFTVHGVRRKCTTKLAQTDLPTVLSEDGVIAFENSSEVTETSRNLFTLSDTINRKFKEFYSVDRQPLVYRDKWFNMYMMVGSTDTNILLYDNRVETWWYWTLPVAVSLIYRYGEDIYVIDKDGTQYDLTDSLIQDRMSLNSTTPLLSYEDVLTENWDTQKITWMFETYPYAFGIPNKGKTLVDTTVLFAPQLEVHTTDEHTVLVDFETVQNYRINLTIRSYDRPNIRDSVKFTSSEQIHALSAKKIRTYIPKFNYASVTMDNIQNNSGQYFDKLMISAFVLSYKVLMNLA